MTPQQEAAVRALVKRVEEERGVTWGHSGLGLWRTEHTPSAAVCDVLAPLLAALDEARRERDEARKALDEREGDMHSRIRAGYDSTIADAWRAKVAKVEQQRDAAEAETFAARSELCALLDGHLSPSDAARADAITRATAARRGWGM